MVCQVRCHSTMQAVTEASQLYAPEACLLLDGLPHLSSDHSTQPQPQLTDGQPRRGCCRTWRVMSS